MIKDKAFWVFIGTLVCIAAFCVGLAILYRDKIQFDPAKAINDGMDFLLALLSMIISFWIAEIYWKRKIEQEQTARAREQINYYLNHIAKIVFETSKALAEQFREGEVDKSEHRDREVLANLRRLGDAQRNTLGVMDASGLELKRDERASRASAYFRSRVIPVLEELSTRSYVRPEVESIESGLSFVGDETHKVIRYLKGEFDESKSPW